MAEEDKQARFDGEIAFSYSDIKGLFKCGHCGAGVIDIDIHRSWHKTGR